MKVEFVDFGFYNVNIDYVRFLHSKDNQVYFSGMAGYITAHALGEV